MKEFTTGSRGNVRVAATGSAIAGGLAELIMRARTIHPDLSVDLIEVNGWTVISDIAAGRADLGLSLSMIDPPLGFSAQPFRAVKMVAVVPADHPLARQRRVNFDEMLEFDHITLGPKSSLTAFFVQQAAERGRVFRYRGVGSFDVMRSLIAAKWGVGIMSELLAIPYAEAMNLVCLPIEEQWAARSIQIWYREEAMTTSVKTFKNYLLNPPAFSGAKG